MKKVFRNIFFILGTTVMLLFGLFYFLKLYTGQNEEPIKTPNLVGLNIFEAKDLIQQMGLQTVVADTTYIDGKNKLEVIIQSPETDLLVKKGRKIYLTINSDKIPKVKMPDLAGKTSLRQAKNMLLSSGLILSEVIERPDPSVGSISDKPVLDQLLKGEKKTIEANTEIPRLSKINLIVGVPVTTDSLSIDSLTKDW